MIPLAEIEELERCVVAANGNTAVRERLRTLRQAARRLVIKPAEDAGVWLVGAEDDPRPYAPVGDFAALRMLLESPNYPIPADVLGSGGARAVRERVIRAADHLAERAPCFAFIRGSLGRCGDALMYQPSAAAPRVIFA